MKKLLDRINWDSSRFQELRDYVADETADYDKQIYLLQVKIEHLQRELWIIQHNYRFGISTTNSLRGDCNLTFNMPAWLTLTFFEDEIAELVESGEPKLPPEKLEKLKSMARVTNQDSLSLNEAIDYVTSQIADCKKQIRNLRSKKTSLRRQLRDIRHYYYEVNYTARNLREQYRCLVDIPGWLTGCLFEDELIHRIETGEIKLPPEKFKK